MKSVNMSLQDDVYGAGVFGVAIDATLMPRFEGGCRAMDEASVWAEYRRLGFDRGWAFAMTPMAWLPEAKVVLVGLNPGGADGEHGVDEACWEYKPGNAYFLERWYRDSDALYPIQVQVAALHAFLGLGPDKVFAAQLIPFRSRTLADLPRREEALGFARKLWTWVLSRSPAKLFLCMGTFTAWHIADLLGAKPDGQWCSGWGRTQVRRFVSPEGRVVVALPHPSRYQLFSMKGDRLEKAHSAILGASAPVT